MPLIINLSCSNQQNEGNSIVASPAPINVFLDNNGDTLSYCLEDGDNHIKCWDYYDAKTKNIRSISTFNSADQLDGLSTKYYSNGSLSFQIEYSADLIWNAIDVKDEQGKDLDFGTLINGDGYLKSFHPNGQIDREGIIVQGLREGYWLSYTPNGNLIDSVKYDHGFTDELDFLDRLYP